MLVAGDEMGRTQRGNNNAYCQDNETGWVDWSLRDAPEWRPLLELTSRLVALRHRHPVLRRRSFFSGRAHSADGLRDLAWFTPHGREMTEGDWYAPAATLGMYLSGRDIPGRDEQGAPVLDDSFLAVLHAGAGPGGLRPPGPTVGGTLRGGRGHGEGGTGRCARRGARGGDARHPDGSVGAAAAGAALTRGNTGRRTRDRGGPGRNSVGSVSGEPYSHC